MKNKTQQGRDYQAGLSRQVTSRMRITWEVVGTGENMKKN